MAGTKGLSDAHHANLLDVAEIWSTEWKQFPTASIVSCWNKAKCLPLNLSSAPQQTEDPDTEMEELCRDIRNLALAATKSVDATSKLGLADLVEATSEGHAAVELMVKDWIVTEANPEACTPRAC